MIVTQQSIIDYLATHTHDQCARYVGRACVVLLNRQTSSEQQGNETNEDNGIGFTGADAYSGSLTAKTFLKNGTLLDWQLEKWTKPNRKGVPRIAKYWRQLNDAAVQRVTQSTPALTLIDDDFNARWAEHKAEFARLEREQEAQAFLRDVR